MKTRVMLAGALALALAGCLFPDRWEAAIIPPSGDEKDLRIAGKFNSYEECKASAAEAMKTEQPGSRFECRKNCAIDPRNTTKVSCDEVKS